MRLDATLKQAEPRLVKIAERLCKSAADARDLVQDTFERVARTGIPEDVRNPPAWLATTMHRLFIDRCRAAARRPVQEPLHDKHDAAATMVDDDEPAWTRLTLDDIHAALHRLEPIYREVYAMHTFDHMPYDEIASRLQIDRVTVGTRLTRARKKLREALVKNLGLGGTS